MRSLYVCHGSLDDPLIEAQVVSYLEGFARARHDVHLLTFVLRPLSKLAASLTKVGGYLAARLQVVSTAGIGDVDAQLDGTGAILEELTPADYRAGAARLAELIGDERMRARCVEIAERQLSLERVGIPAYVALYDYVARQC